MNSVLPIQFFTYVLSNPKLMLKMASAEARKHIGVKIGDYNKEDGSSSYPRQISMKITNLCNLRCKMCGQWGETGYNWEKDKTELKNVVPLHVYKKMVDDVAKESPFIYIWGGEPFLYPDLMDLTQYMKKKGLTLSLVTNGVKLEDNAEQIVTDGWDALMLSLDGPEETHDEIRGVPGTFQKLKRGVHKINAYKKQQNTPFPFVMMLVTVTDENAGRLHEIFEVGRQFNADCMVVYYSWFTNQAIGKAHTSIFERELDTTPTCWKGYLFDHDNVDTDALVREIRKIRADEYEFPYIFIPNLRDEQIPEYYKNPGELFGYGPCIAPWSVVELMPDGKAAPCRDYPDYIVGDLMEQSIHEIFNSERYKKFRRTLRSQKDGLFPICSRCCGLMGW
jgi:radical SAM protein with 4Fe4S-binding SPASM domain